MKKKGPLMHLYCPCLSKGIEGFGTKRAIYKELLETEKYLTGRVKAWVGYTNYKNGHIIRMYLKLGAKFFYLHPISKNAWYIKYLEGA
jgi:outer membrane protein assembly factor BamD (BamD/ComL family)